MNKRESICEKCEKIFTHKNDRLGKFCSQRCHYASKRETANCAQCGREFLRRIKDPRKTCSNKCYMLSRGIKSSAEDIKEICEYLKKEEAGQTNIDEGILDKIRRTFNKLFTPKS